MWAQPLFLKTLAAFFFSFLELSFLCPTFLLVRVFSHSVTKSLNDLVSVVVTFFFFCLLNILLRCSFYGCGCSVNFCDNFYGSTCTNCISYTCISLRASDSNILHANCRKEFIQLVLLVVDIFFAPIFS